jgi:hypothetical protein
MQFSTIAISFLSLMTATMAAPSPSPNDLSIRDALASGIMVKYPADHSIEMIRRDLEASSVTARDMKPCYWCGMTLCCYKS